VLKPVWIMQIRMAVFPRQTKEWMNPSKWTFISYGMSVLWIS